MDERVRVDELEATCLTAVATSVATFLTSVATFLASVSTAPAAFLTSVATDCAALLTSSDGDKYQAESEVGDVGDANRLRLS